jgi:hypothetical protein
MPVPMITAQLVDGAGLPLGIAGAPLPVVAAPGEAHLGQVGGTTVITTGVLIRPADTVAYAVGDLVGGNVAAGAANLLTLTNVPRIPGGTGRIIRLRVATNQAAFAGTLRVHLFKTAVAPGVGDKGALAGAVANYVNYYGSADVTLGQGILADGSKGFMAFSPPIGFDVPAGVSDIYAVLETRTAFTPAASQRFSVTIEADVD